MKRAGALSSEGRVRVWGVLPRVETYKATGKGAASSGQKEAVKGRLR